MRCPSSARMPSPMATLVWASLLATSWAPATDASADSISSRPNPGSGSRSAPASGPGRRRALAPLGAGPGASQPRRRGGAPAGGPHPWRASTATGASSQTTAFPSHSAARSARRWGPRPRWRSPPGGHRRRKRPPGARTPGTPPRRCGRRSRGCCAPLRETISSSVSTKSSSRRPARSRPTVDLPLAEAETYQHQVTEREGQPPRRRGAGRDRRGPGPPSPPPSARRGGGRRGRGGPAP